MSEDNIENADIIVDLSGGKLTTREFRKRIAAQAKALRRYGRHDRQCFAIFDSTLDHRKNPPVAADCNCGFTQALGE